MIEHFKVGIGRIICRTAFGLVLYLSLTVVFSVYILHELQQLTSHVYHHQLLAERRQGGVAQALLGKGAVPYAVVSVGQLVYERFGCGAACGNGVRHLFVSFKAAGIVQSVVKRIIQGVYHARLASGAESRIVGIYCVEHLQCIPGIRNHTFAGKLERINCGCSIGMSAS